MQVNIHLRVIPDDDKFIACNINSALRQINFLHCPGGREFCFPPVNPQAFIYRIFGNGCVIINIQNHNMASTIGERAPPRRAPARYTINIILYHRRPAVIRRLQSVVLLLRARSPALNTRQPPDIISFHAAPGSSCHHRPCPVPPGILPPVRRGVRVIISSLFHPGQLLFLRL